MLEKPDLEDPLIMARLLDEYGLRAAQVTFLPLGVDVNTVVYGVVTEEGTPYFLKLRKGAFDEITVAVPHFLKAQGITSIIAPLATKDRQAWGSLGTYKMVLYPFIEGKNGYQVALSDQQWLDFGAALKGIHTVQVPPASAQLIPRETYSPRWREFVKTFQMQVEVMDYGDPVAAKLAAFMKARRGEIANLVGRADQLGLALQARTLEFVLCHADIHAGNLLICSDGRLFIVDWDNPIFAPKERDLALVGGCPNWHGRREESLFYQGYSEATVDRMALAYYRYERIIQDIAAYCEQLLLTDQGGEDREQSYRYCTDQFLPDHEVELAFKTDKSIAASRLDR